MGRGEDLYRVAPNGGTGMEAWQTMTVGRDNKKLESYFQILSAVLCRLLTTFRSPLNLGDIAL